jgi:hypothetical protein
MLPWTCTEALGIQAKPTGSRLYTLINVGKVMPFIDDAQLLPCSAADVKDGGWHLVVRVKWALPEKLGQKVWSLGWDVLRV